ncbi:DnaB helicase C-terminal domain-containing protein [Priestia aryabhattai]|uniref:DnaB-like helicase C-terminal domain-containing protein n=1 Tax=Priestia aryabhattai TaxID=412384 RepID=UPI00203F814E|nr:DnaB-like helicase C-terminal domain-containing protein [Priestia aryabhattai]MCM3639685.1 DnaB helicase C-terminal domain-containing protein [Priestia aryabhattai]
MNSTMVEHQLISKVLEEKNFYILNKFNVTEKDFYTIPEVYSFVKDYTKEHGQTPDYRTVVSEFESFNYMPESVDNFGYLTKALKNATAKRGAMELFQKKAGLKFNEMQGTDFVNWMANEIKSLQDTVSADSYSGENFAVTGQERWASYEDSKENRTYKFIPTPYESLTAHLGGGFELGDYVLLQAYSNRGKSWVASHIGVKSWLEGYGVLHYSPELSYDQQAQRNDTLIGHFNNMQLKTGQLKNEDAYKEYLQAFNEEDQETPYIIKTMEHLPKGLSVGVIEADLIANPECKMVIIDGFNLMAHAGKGSNRDSMSTTSRQLRQLFARHQVVGIVVHQTPTSAEKENGGDDEDGARIVAPAKIHQYSETIAVIQDACTVLSFDQHDGMGKILIAKTRTPAVNKEITLHCDYNHGYIKEASIIDHI